MSATLNPLKAAEQIERRYRSYLASTFEPRRPELRAELRKALEEHTLTKGLYLEASAPFKAGRSVVDLVNDGLLSREFLRFSPEAFPIERTLHAHQERAVQLAVGDKRNLIVSTGTGSGKTETFLLPIMQRLLAESEAGTLAAPGVRALLLYPMNALANDQVKRLRGFLKDFPEITFGRYVGETESDPDKAEEVFARRYPNEPRVENELLSRQEMQDRPPHILITNYAMLEYLLLRPSDSSLFDGDSGRHWSTIVLDEAHIYDGAQGAEVAMLLRRVRDRVLESRKGHLQCFATSATLGKGAEDYPAMVRFAEDLFDEPFAETDIVVAQRKNLVEEDALFTWGPEDLLMAQKVYRNNPVDQLAADFAAPVSPEPGEEAQSWLGRMLATEENVRRAQELLQQGPISVERLSTELFGGPDHQDAVVALIELCVFARRRSDDAPLIPARYHLWVGSLEGGFLCLHPEHDPADRRLFLNRLDTCPGCDKHGRVSRLVELGVCRSCGTEFAVGETKHEASGDAFRPPGDRNRNPKYLMLTDSRNEADEDSDAGVADAQTLAVDAASYNASSGRIDMPPSSHAAAVNAVWVQTDDNKVLRKCPSCSASSNGEVVFRLTTGTDAPVAVVATELYQALPKSSDPHQAEEVGGGRKLLAFSDSRQDAAYFAPFFGRTYKRSVSRRLIWQAVNELADDHEAPRSEDVLQRAEKLARQYQLVDEDDTRATRLRQVGTWLAQEYLALDRRQSLDGLGLVDVRPWIPRKWTLPGYLSELGFDRDQAADLIRLLLDSLRTQGAITTPTDVNIEDRDFEPRNVQIAARLTGSESKVVAWMPSKPGGNRRSEIVQKALRSMGADPALANDVLKAIWGDLTDSSSPWGRAEVLVSTSAKGAKGVVFQLNHDQLEWAPNTTDSLQQCSVCQVSSFRSAGDTCPRWRCDGRMFATDAIGRGENHYADLYRELHPTGVSVEEHTAQWTAGQASEIQDQFTKGTLNMLSCSTTFELGVDVGDIQAVMLRNVPPRAANYVQRAGRAGRRSDSAALVVTYAQRRPHDRQHFDDPVPMIGGTIDPPKIALENEIIIRRHAHSVAFAAYQRHLVDSGEPDRRRVGDFFFAEQGRSHDERWVEWLDGRPADVGDALDRLVPQHARQDLEIDAWGWVDALSKTSEKEPAFGWLERAASEVQDDIEELEAQYAEAKKEDDLITARSLQDVVKTLKKRRIIDYLASRNVLPKYGFPVDVVELDVSRSGDRSAGRLDLSRDLRSAIREYAPTSQIVAGGKVWQSVGLKLQRNRDWPEYSHFECDDCNAFQTRVGKDAQVTNCEVCTSPAVSRKGNFVLPEFGFVGEYEEEAGHSRPTRIGGTKVNFGQYGEVPPEPTEISGFGGAVRVVARSSRQGRIITRSSMPFRICNFCGYSVPSAGAPPKAHMSIRRPGQPCAGSLRRVAELGHEYLTDVTEIRFEPRTALTRFLGMYPEPIQNSVLYAFLAAAPRLGIARDDVDGVLSGFAADTPDSIILFDTVPGGAGHARLLGERLAELARAALHLVENCTCAEERACYGCLLTYSNQQHHEDLSRRDAAEVLHALLDQKDEDLSLFSPAVRPLLRALGPELSAEAVPGYEIPSPERWQVEAAWPTQKVAVFLEAADDKSVEKRNTWLLSHGWDARHHHQWRDHSLRVAIAPVAAP